MPTKEQQSPEYIFSLRDENNQKIAFDFDGWVFVLNPLPRIGEKIEVIDDEVHEDKNPETFVVVDIMHMVFTSNKGIEQGGIITLRRAQRI